MCCYHIFCWGHPIKIEIPPKTHVWKIGGRDQSGTGLGVERPPNNNFRVGLERPPSRVEHQNLMMMMRDPTGAPHPPQGRPTGCYEKLHPVGLPWGGGSTQWVYLGCYEKPGSNTVFQRFVHFLRGQMPYFNDICTCGFTPIFQQTSLIFLVKSCWGYSPKVRPLGAIFSQHPVGLPWGGVAPSGSTLGWGSPSGVSQLMMWFCFSTRPSVGTSSKWTLLRLAIRHILIVNVLTFY